MKTNLILVSTTRFGPLLKFMMMLTILCFISMFTDVLNTHASLKQKRVKHNNLPDWYNAESGYAPSHRDKAKTQNNISEFKYWRNKTKTLISEAKQSFYTKSINQNKQNPKKK